MLAGEDDPDVLTCRAIWSIIKEHRISVRIPFAMRIKFSNAANRRNPAIGLEPGRLTLYRPLHRSLKTGSAGPGIHPPRAP